jgi:hypothetical protein
MLRTGQNAWSLIVCKSVGPGQVNFVARLCGMRIVTRTFLGLRTMLLLIADEMAASGAQDALSLLPPFEWDYTQRARGPVVCRP